MLHIPRRRAPRYGTYDKANTIGIVQHQRRYHSTRYQWNTCEIWSVEEVFKILQEGNNDQKNPINSRIPRCKLEFNLNVFLWRKPLEIPHSFSKTTAPQADKRSQWIREKIKTGNGFAHEVRHVILLLLRRSHVFRTPKRSLQVAFASIEKERITTQNEWGIMDERYEQKIKAEKDGLKLSERIFNKIEYNTQVHHYEYGEVYGGAMKSRTILTDNDKMNTTI